MLYTPKTDKACFIHSISVLFLEIRKSELTCAASVLLSNVQLQLITLYGGPWVQEHSGPVHFTVILFKICNVVQHRIIFRDNFKNTVSYATLALSNLFFAININGNMTFTTNESVSKCKCKGDIAAEDPSDPSDLCFAGTCIKTKQQICMSRRMHRLLCSIKGKCTSGLKTKLNRSNCTV